MWRSSLRELLSERPTEVVGAEATQLRLAAGIAAGMAFLHAHGVLHHDLKSANVLLFANADGSLRPKLSDFGLAARLEGSTSSSSMMQAGAGTFAYKAPEQFE